MSNKEFSYKVVFWSYIGMAVCIIYLILLNL